MLVGYRAENAGGTATVHRAISIAVSVADEVRGIVFDVAGEWGAEHGRRDVQTTNKVIDVLVRNLVGLSATDVRRLASKPSRTTA